VLGECGGEMGGGRQIGLVELVDDGDSHGLGVARRSPAEPDRNQMGAGNILIGARGGDNEGRLGGGMAICGVIPP
jgi:hypothetical protein